MEQSIKVLHAFANTGVAIGAIGMAVAIFPAFGGGYFPFGMAVFLYGLGLKILIMFMEIFLRLAIAHERIASASERGADPDRPRQN